jgi:hypothetical protein
MPHYYLFIVVLLLILGALMASLYRLTNWVPCALSGGLCAFAAGMNFMYYLTRLQ